MNPIRTVRHPRARLTAAIVASVLVASCAGGGDGSGEAGEGSQASADGDGGSNDSSSRLADTWDEIVAAAADEGALVISAMRGTGYERWCGEVQSAMAEFDVSVDCTNQSPSDWVGRVISEQDGGAHLWDVFVGPISNLQTAVKPAGATQPLGPWVERLPDGVADDDAWHEGFGVYSDDDEHILITQYNLSGGTYVNTAQAPAISEPSDLFSSDLEGELIAYDPTQSNDGSMSLSWFLDHDDFGEDGVTGLVHDQRMTFVESPALMLQWLADGRAAVGFGANQIDLVELQDVGIGEEIERFDFGQYLIAYGTAVLADNPNPNATAVFLDWHLSQAGQQFWVDTSHVLASSRRSDVTNPDGTPDYENLEQYPTVIGTEAGNALVQRVTELAE